MKMERKHLLNGSISPMPRDRLNALLIGKTEADCVELQAAFAQFPELSIETLMTSARLPATTQKPAAPPDIVFVDVNSDNSEDLALLRDLRKVAGMEHTPLVALIHSVTDNAPLRVMRAGASDVLLKPIDGKEARDVFSRVVEFRGHNREAMAPCKTVVFMHLSGGAGATTLAVNAACALARASKTKSVALLDLDVQFGNAASLLDIAASSPLQGFLDDPFRLDHQMLDSMMLPHPTGLRVLTAPATLVPLTAYAAEGISNMLNFTRERYGFAILDLPVALAPWTDTVLRASSLIYLVVELSVPSAHRLAKFLHLLDEENISDLPLKIVANRYRPSNRKGNDVTVAQFEKSIGRKVDFLIPNDYSLISMSHGQGKPAVRLDPKGPFSAALTKMLGETLAPDIFAKPPRRFFSFGRG